MPWHEGNERTARGGLGMPGLNSRRFRLIKGTVARALYVSPERVSIMHLDEFLLAAVILLAGAAVFVFLFKRLGLGSVLGFLAAGIIAGPSGFAITTEVDQLRHFTELGVVLLMFVIGLEMRPSKLWSMRGAVFGLGSAQVLFTGMVIAGYVMLNGFEWKVALILGLGFALSSTAFVVQMLAERGDMATPHGKAAFAVLLMQDIAIVPLLAMVPVLAEAPVMASEQPFWLEVLAVAGLICCVLAVGRYVIPWLLAKTAQSRNMEAFGIVTMLAALGAAYVMELVGVSMALGAFLVGMTLSASEYRHQIEAAVEPFKGLMLGLFFISVGMSIDVSLLWNFSGAVAEAVFALLILKVATLFVLGLVFGLGRSVAARTAFILSQCGEFGFVLFGAAHAAGLLSAEMFAVSLSLITVTMIVTPLMTKLGDFLANRLAAAPGAGAPTDEAGVDLARHVVVAGYGRGGRVICLMLEKSGIPFVAFDMDPNRVWLGKREGRNVRFGDMTDPHVLDASGIGDAAALVVTLYDMHQTEKLVSTVRNFYPGVPVYARVRNLSNRDSLLAHGVTHAMPEVAEGSLQLGKAVLRGVGSPDGDVRDLLDALRRQDYAMLRPIT